MLLIICPLPPSPPSPKPQPDLHPMVRYGNRSHFLTRVLRLGPDSPHVSLPHVTPFITECASADGAVAA